MKVLIFLPLAKPSLSATFLTAFEIISSGVMFKSLVFGTVNTVPKTNDLCEDNGSLIFTIFHNTITRPTSLSEVEELIEI